MRTNLSRIFLVDQMRIVKRSSLFTILVAMLHSSSIYCQSMDWWTFELEGVGVNFPFEEVSQNDTILQGIRVKLLYCQYENATLILQKQLVGNNISELPHDHETLRNYHHEVIKGMKDKFESEVTKKEINHKSFIGTNATFIKDEKPFSESNIFLIENYIIIATYHSTEPFDDETKKEFLYSLDFGDLEPSSQMIGESKAYQQGVLFGKIVFYGILGIGTFFVIRGLQKK